MSYCLMFSKCIISQYLIIIKKFVHLPAPKLVLHSQQQFGINFKNPVLICELKYQNILSMNI